MARFTVIGDVTLELRSQIYAALDGAPFVDFGLPPISQAIYVGPPDGDDIDDNAVVALYLYQVLPSGHLRNQRLLPDSENPSRFRKPPLPLELRYIVIPLENDETGHQHLRRIVQHFHDHRSFDTLEGEPLGDSFGGAASTLRVAIDPLNMDQLTQLWSVQLALPALAGIEGRAGRDRQRPAAGNAAADRRDGARHGNHGMTALESLSAAGTVQVLLGGRVSNAVTGRGVDAPSLALSFDPDGSGCFIAVPARLARRADGWFAWHLAPEQMPGASGPDAALRIEASAAGHSAALATLAIDPSDSISLRLTLRFSTASCEHPNVGSLPRSSIAYLGS